MHEQMTAFSIGVHLYPGGEAVHHVGRVADDLRAA